MKLRNEKTRFVSSTNLEEKPTSIDRTLQIEFGQLLEKDLHEDKLNVHLNDDGSWMFRLSSVHNEESTIYSFREIEDTLEHLSIDLSQTDWYSNNVVGSNKIISAHTEPDNFNKPTKYLSEIGTDFLMNESNMMPAKADDIDCCSVCGERTTKDQDAYCLFGQSRMKFHKHCFYNFIATLQDILDGIEATIVSKSI